MSPNVTVNEQYIWILIHQISDLLAKCESIIAYDSGLSREKYTVLTTIKFFNEVVNEQIKISDIAPILNRSITSISTIVDRMEKEGLVRKRRKRLDHRSNSLVITPKALELIKTSSKPYMELMHNLFSIFSGDEQSKLISQLISIRRRMTEELGREEIQANSQLDNFPKMHRFLIGLSE